VAAHGRGALAGLCLPGGHHNQFTASQHFPTGTLFSEGGEPTAACLSTPTTTTRSRALPRLTCLLTTRSPSAPAAPLPAPRNWIAERTLLRALNSYNAAHPATGQPLSTRASSPANGAPAVTTHTTATAPSHTRAGDVRKGGALKVRMVAPSHCYPPPFGFLWDLFSSFGIRPLLPVCLPTLLLPAFLVNAFIQPLSAATPQRVRRVRRTRAWLRQREGACDKEMETNWRGKTARLYWRVDCLYVANYLVSP